jgi:RimJ/RimL family protein N-acetyltransferase
MTTTLVSSDLDTAVTDFYTKGIPVTIETKDLFLRPACREDLPFFERLFTDYDTMKLYTDNEGRLKEKGFDAWKADQMKTAASRVATFAKRWEDRVPFSGFVLCKKVTEAEQDPRVGFIVTGFGDKAGQSEMAFAVKKEEQRHGYGQQSIDAVVQGYIPTLIAIHQKVHGKPLEIGDAETGFAPLTEVLATSREDNLSSIHRLEKAGLKKVNENANKWGNLRGIYSIVYENSKV